MSLFDENSAFHRGNRGELDKLSPYDPIVDQAQRQSDTSKPSIPQDVLERWYAALSEEAGLVAQEGRTRVAADQTKATLRMVADEIYSYLK